ncbi:CSCL2 protein, partial [Polypterus senegalus]
MKGIRKDIAKNAELKMITLLAMTMDGGSSTCSGNCSTRINSNKEYCYSARIRSTVLQGLPFGGVPTVLALDFMCFLVLLFVFSILRKVAWDYGRLALVTDADSVASALHSETPDRYERLTSVSSSVDFDQRDYGFCSWLTAIFRIKDEEIREKCGGDAVHYLSFQRHIIGLLVVVGVLSVGIVLPVNFSGDLLENNAYSFGRTTIANLKSENNLLWLHTSFAFLYLLLTVYSMRRHTSKMHYKEDDLVKRTLFIIGISKYASEDQIKRHFEQAYNNCKVLEARLCYNVARLMALDGERKKAERGRKFFTDLMAKEHIPTMINPKPCGHLCCCVIKGCEQVEAVEYYTNLETRLKEEYVKEKGKVYEKPLGMGFVTFQNEAMTAVILKDFNACKCQGCKCRMEPQHSQFSEGLHVHNWTVTYAPDPQNVYCLDVFFRWLFDKKFLAEAKIRFECVFLPDNGAFFVNYVIASAFIGNAMDLLRIPGLLMYMIRLCLARSAAERNVKRFGAAYAWMMCVFTVVMTYSITCPIIVPFGFLASTTSMFTFIVLIVTIVICLSHVCFGHFKYLSAHNYKIDSQDADTVDGIENGPTVQTGQSPKKSTTYVAHVLQDPGSEEAGGGSGEEEERGSSQDDEMINTDNSINEADFQSGEDSLLANEVHQ